jgi:CHASE2 domain-containing sensor protein
MKLLKGYRKYLYERDTVFATIAVFVVIGLLAFVPLNTHILNPVKEAFADFDFNDIVYAKVGKNDKIPFDNRIIIVNIGAADRAGIAGMLEKVAAQKPKVIGLDAYFEGPREPESDSLLEKVMYSIPNLVMASRLAWEHHETHLSENRGYFNRPEGNFAFVNLVGEEKGTIRHYAPFEEYHHKEYLSFSAAVLEKSYPEAYKKLFTRHKDLETINYSRNIDKYLTIDGNDVLADNIMDTVFKDKVVLLGYVNPSPYDIEDKFYTSMNPKMIGTSPDMNGIVIHANFISMALDKKYIHRSPVWVNWIITILIAWLHVSLFIRYYIDAHLWFHLVAKGAQLVSAILFVALSVWCLSFFSLKIDMKMPVTVIILAIDVIYFYEALAVFLREKFGFKTIFHHKH